jgi:transmembrane sensor
MENIQPRIYILLAKKNSGEASKEEMAELQELLYKNKTLPFDNELLTAFWQTRGLKKINALAVDSSWQSIEQKLLNYNDSTPARAGENAVPGKRYKKRSWLFAAAAIFVIVISIPLLLFLNNAATNNLGIANLQETTNQIVANRGYKTGVTLPDGTRMWLNAGSVVNYHKNFTVKREVYLNGEAYFDVTYNPGKPFVIHIGSVNVKVLGTTFNLKSYPEDDKVEAALLKGSIEVTTTDDPERKILLRPNEKITILKRKIAKNTFVGIAAIPAIDTAANKEELYSISRIMINKKDSTAEDIAWMEDRLVFKGESFGQLALKMQRWYNVTINFADEYCKNMKFTGVFDKQTIDQALKALQFSCDDNFSFTINKNQITIQKQ